MTSAALFNASLDRTNTSSRQAMHIVAPALVAAGVDLQSITLSTISLHEARKDAGEAIGNRVKENFCPKIQLIAHFDGKMLPNCDGVKSDRMPVVVSGKCVEKLLGIPRLHNTSGDQMGRKIVLMLQSIHILPVSALIQLPATRVSQRGDNCRPSSFQPNASVLRLPPSHTRVTSDCSVRYIFRILRPRDRSFYTI